MAEQAGRGCVERLEDARPLWKIPNERQVGLVVHQLRLLGTNDVRMRVEHLLEERCAGARMAAEQRDAPGRAEFVCLRPPAGQDVGSERSLHLLAAVLHELQGGSIRGRMSA